MKFPFSDLENAKVRPALVVSNERYNNRYLDRVVVALTSNLSPADFKIILDDAEC